MILLPLTDAKRHLRVTDPADDAEVQQTLEHASAITFDLYAESADPTWDETTAPPDVQRVTMMFLGNLWEHRGDDAEPDQKIFDAVRPFMVRRRPITIA